MIKQKQQTNGIEIDLTGPQGNAYFLLGTAKKFGKQLGMGDSYIKEMLDKIVRIGRAFPPFYDWCRISTGTSQEVDKFISAMLEVYS